MSKKQKYSKGDLVQVTEFYNDLIPKSGYTGIITGVKKFEGSLKTHIIYEILDMETNQVKTAEDFAIAPLRRDL